MFSDRADPNFRTKNIRTKNNFDILLMENTQDS